MGERALTCAQAREVDRIAISEFAIPGLVLMENAGLLATLEIIGELSELGCRGGPVVVLCGGGNNGGDGYVIARQLANRGIEVVVQATRGVDRLTGDALVNRRIVDAMGVDVADLSRTWPGAALVVDALLGTGFQGPVRGTIAETIEALNETRVPVIAIDVPSGLDADRGLPSDVAVEADLTLTFVAPKVGFEVPGAERWTGEVRVLAIGAPPEVVRRVLSVP